MSINDSIKALKTAKTDIAAAITEKGGKVNAGDGFSSFSADIKTIPEGGGGGGADLNIAYSDTPPSDTNKLWVKRSTSASKVFARQDISGFILGTCTTMSATLAYEMGYTSCAAVGTDIYIFGGYDNSSSSYVNTIQKYDTITGTCTTMSATLSSAMGNTSCAAVGTDIYIFGGITRNSGGSNSYFNIIQKYDTITGTRTTMSATLSAAMCNTSCAAVGTDIYIFGGRTHNSGSATYYYFNTIQKYDTITGTRTTMSATLSSAMHGTSCAAVGTDIYIFGGYDSNDYFNTIQKYDTITGTCTTMSATLYYGLSSTSCAAVGTDIYIFGGVTLVDVDPFTSISQYISIIQKYDTITGTRTTMSATLAYEMCNTSCAAVGTDIYIFGGYDNSSSSYVNTIQHLMLELSLAQNNILLTSYGGTKDFKLLDSDTAEIWCRLKNAYIGNDSDKAEYVDAYIYNGEWVNVNTDEVY